MMQEKNYLFITAVVFLIISLLHILRLILGWEAEIGGWMMPFWLSWIAFILAGFLAYLGFKFIAKKP